MEGFDLAGFSGQAERLGRDLQELGGVAKVEPGFDPVIGGLEYRDVVIEAERCDALAGPAIAVARLEAVAVEEAGNQIVAGDQHQLTHGLDNISRSAVAFSAPTLGQAQLAVGCTHPVDDENDLGRRLVDIGHDLMDEGAYNALLEASIRRRRIPDRFEVRGENAERSWISNGCGRRRITHGDLALDLRRVSERPVPARFKFTRHQPVRRVSGIELPESPVGGIARRFEVATERIAHLILSFFGFPGSSGCSGDRAWADNAKQCFLDCIIDAQSSEGDAERAAIIHPGAAAAVARDMVLHACVPDGELAATALAPDQAGQQRVSMLGRAVMPTGGNVAADHCADRLDPLPAHVPFVGVGLQRQPFVPPLAADLHAHALGGVSRRHSRLTIGIGAAVDRVINDPVDGGVTRSPPTLPRQTSATIRSKPARCTPPAAERPRSSSITSTSDHPSAVSRSRMAYCNALLSRLCNT